MFLRYKVGFTFQSVFLQFVSNLTSGTRSETIFIHQTCLVTLYPSQRKSTDSENVKPQIHSRDRTQRRPEKANRLDSRTPTPRAYLPLQHIKLDRREAATWPWKRDRPHARAHTQRLHHAFRIISGAFDADIIPGAARAARKAGGHAT